VLGFWLGFAPAAAPRAIYGLRGDFVFLPFGSYWSDADLVIKACGT
jgi:hypothetical protein